MADSAHLNIDLAHSPEETAGAGDLSVPTVEVVEVVQLPERMSLHRERTRTWLAAIVLCSVPAIAVLTFALAFTRVIFSPKDLTMGDIEAFGMAMLTPVTGICGAVIGFYYSQMSVTRHS